jgi:hypothetical protein
VLHYDPCCSADRGVGSVREMEGVGGHGEGEGASVKSIRALCWSGCVHCVVLSGACGATLLNLVYLACITANARSIHFSR